jgi:hypothetical protein
MGFYRYVGFTITRKQARLENYDKRNRNTSTPLVHLPLPQPFPNPSSK